jgi:hypothetical protein
MAEVPAPARAAVKGPQGRQKHRTPACPAAATRPIHRPSDGGVCFCLTAGKPVPPSPTVRFTERIEVPKPRNSLAFMTEESKPYAALVRPSHREEMPKFIEPMLATSAPTPTGEQWAIEVKWDARESRRGSTATTFAFARAQDASARASFQSSASSPSSWAAAG